MRLSVRFVDANGQLQVVRCASFFERGTALHFTFEDGEESIAYRDDQYPLVVDVAEGWS